ncbi:MAG: MotA/TolQ/ExbB proton channel family protein [Bdellovibrionota bacterium]
MQIIHFLNEAGAVGWFIAFIGLGTLGIIGERYYHLYIKLRFEGKAFLSKIGVLVEQRKIDEALLICSQHPDIPLVVGVQRVLENCDKDLQGLQQIQDIVLTEQLPRLAARIGYLSMLANVATLLGLLGTIHGLILSFQAVAAADAALKQTLLAQGISVSMYTTALGLVVAIPGMMAFSFLTTRQNSLTEETIEGTSKVIEKISSTIFTQNTPRFKKPEAMPMASGFNNHTN